MSTLTAIGMYPQVGERIYIDGNPRAITNIVRRVFSESSCEIETIRRASRGYRRHIRRQKASRAN